MDIIDGDCNFYDEASRMDATGRKRYMEGVYTTMLINHFGFNRAYTGRPILEDKKT